VKNPSSLAASLDGNPLRIREIKRIFQRGKEMYRKFRRWLMAETKDRADKIYPHKMRDAELVIVNDMDFAIVLRYAPGETPKVLLKGRKEKAKDIIWSAQELEIPIVEMTLIDEAFFASLNVDEEIPEQHYRPVAQALALLYKIKASPHRVSFIKTLRSRPSVLRNRAEELVEKYSSFLEVSLVSLELGKDLYDHVEKLRAPLDSLRQRIALEIGIVIPEIVARHNTKFGPLSYSVRMREVPIYDGEVEEIKDRDEFVFHLVNKIRLLITRQAWQLLSYTEVEALIDRMKKYNKGLYRELFPKYFTITALRFILRNLLKEGISIRDLSKILEVIKEHLHITQDPDVLTEFVRTSFAAYLCNKHKNQEGYLEVLLMDPPMEQLIMNSIKESSQVRWLDLDPEDGLKLLTSLGEEFRKAHGIGLSPVLLCSPGLRRFLKRLLDSSFPDLPVLSYNEIVPLTEVRSVGIVK
jgi:flagellar biosynthesis component FlhA